MSTINDPVHMLGPIPRRHNTEPTGPVRIFRFHPVIIGCSGDCRQVVEDRAGGIGHGDFDGGTAIVSCAAVDLEAGGGGSGPGASSGTGRPYRRPTHPSALPRSLPLQFEDSLRLFTFCQVSP